MSDEEKNPLEVAAEVAEQKKAELDSAKEAQKEADKKEKETPKDDSTIKKPTAEEAEAEQEKIQKIISTKDSELSEEDLKIKKETLSKNKDVRAQEKIDKRFSELTTQIDDLKKEKDGDKDRILNLEKERDALEKKQKGETEAQSFDEQAKEAKDKRITDQLEEDKDKPRDERREITRDELQDWMDEDLVSSQEWLAERTLRREKERLQFKYDHDSNKAVEDFYNKQTTSTDKVHQKHPELNIVSRTDELRTTVESKFKSEGKDITNAEIIKKVNAEIHETICKENEKYRICSEIIAESPDKYLLDIKGPESVMLEMEKRLVKVTKKDDNTDGKIVFNSQEELDAHIKEQQEEENDRQKSIDEGLSSTRSNQSKGISDFDKKQLDLAKMAGLTKETLDKNIARRKKIPGAV